jgi:hypothetical protein
MAVPTSGGTQTKPSGIPNRKVWFPSVGPACLQSGARPTNDIELHRGEVQKVGIVISNISNLVPYFPIGPPMFGP